MNRLLPFLAVSVFACAPETEMMPPEIMSFSVEPSTVEAGETVEVTLELMHFTFSDGDHGDHGGDHMGHAHGDEMAGHVHIYLDDLETNPVKMMMSADDVAVTIPTDIEAGEHVLIARLHRGDHTVYEPSVMSEADLTVTIPSAE